MEDKSNDATPQRPQGDRILNAELVEMDLNKSIIQIKEETSWQASDRNSITLFKSDSIRIVLLGLHKNAELKTHQAKGIINVQVLEGRIDFITEKKSVSLEKGQLIALQANIPHSVIAITEAFFMLTIAIPGK
jgi:quercetin dioxygenase-like cupin family protein